jgi:NAD(P)-dependent dehydrogenase (short-subunit alcohol dehydrogenase family)
MTSNPNEAQLEDADRAGRGVVITGAGSGIGAALARKLAAQGERLVLNDLDAAAVSAVAAEVGALAVPGNAAGEEGVLELITRARAELGVVDLFFANAGIGVHGGPEAAEDGWQRSWDVNVMAHVRAARLLVPDWLEAGQGHFVATVSAAGLLTMPGSAPYSVTKHAALAFAEWMSVSYGHRGITVQAICPQGVRTPMLDSAGPVGELVLAPEAIDAADLADVVAGSLDGGPFLILPHPEVAGYYAGRAADPDAWLARMQRAQDRLDAALGTS